VTGRHHPDPAALRRILTETRSVAIVGVSANAARPSHGVFRYLRAHTPYRLFLVNPTIDELDGLPVYPTLADLPEPPDLVDVFRRREELPAVAAEAIAAGARTLWLQQGLWDEQVARDAEAAGLTVVMDRCLKVDHATLCG